MEELDTKDITDQQISDEEELILSEVIKGDADLFYLHHYLTEIFQKGNHF